MMAIKPWGGVHANLLHCLRSQGENQLKGGNYPGLCETILPMSGRPLRAYLGIRADFQALVAAADATHRNASVRTHQESASGTTARAIPPGRSLATSLTAETKSLTPRFNQCSPRQCHQGALFDAARGYHIGMPAAQAYKPPTHSHMTPTIVVRRYPRSGRLPVKTPPKNSKFAAGACPRLMPVKFAAHLGAPNYRCVVARSPAQSAGYLAWVQGTALPLGGRAARAPHKKLSVAN